MSVHATYELRVLRKLEGSGEFVTVEHFDELESSTAKQRYREEAARARSWIGTHREIRHHGRTHAGRVLRLMVELMTRKHGDTWTSDQAHPVTGADGEPMTLVLDGSQEPPSRSTRREHSGDRVRT